MAKTKGKPDNQYLADYLQEKREEYSERDRIDERMYKLYHGTYVHDLPANIRADEIKTGYATQFIDRVLGIFTHTYPTFHMTPTGEGDEPQARSSKAEIFLNALFKNMQQEAGVPTWNLITLDTLLYGRGVSCLPPAGGNYWKDYPGQEEGEENEDYNKRTEEWKKVNRLPMAWRHVPSMNEYPDEDDYGLAEIATVEQRSLRRLCREYPDQKSKLIKRWGSDNMSRKLSFVKYADRDYLAYFVGEAPTPSEPDLLYTVPHYCGQVPYVRIKGKATSAAEPEFSTMSLLYHMEPLVMYLERLLIQKGTAIRIWCWPKLVMRRKAMDAPLGDEESPLRQQDINLDPTKTLELLEGEDAFFLVWTGNPPDIDEQVANIQRYLDRMGLASVMYGTTAADASSGYAINTLIQAAQSLFGPIAQNLAEGYRQLGVLALKHVELFGQTLYVFRQAKRGWISLGPDDIKGYRYLEAKVKAKLPQELPVNAQIALQLTQGPAPLMDRIWARTELLDDESPEKTEARIRIQQWKDSPEVRQWYTMKNLQAADMQLATPEGGGGQPQGPIAPALAGLLGQPGLAGPSMQAPGGMLGQATVPMVPGVGLSANNPPQQPGPQAQVNTAEARLAPVAGGRRAGAARKPGGPRKGGGTVP